MTGNRADALARLDVFAGEWVLQARFPGGQPIPPVRTLTRESPDFTPLDFRQRFTATFSQDGNTISGAWEKRLNGSGWEHDFRPHLPQGRLT